MQNDHPLYVGRRVPPHHHRPSDGHLLCSATLFGRQEVSRSGYSDDYDLENWDLIRWRGQVASAIRGKRGQAFLRELVAALDAMPEKRLIANELESFGNVCAIGSVGMQRGVDMTKLDPDDYDRIAATFGIAPQLVQEIEWMNDEAYFGETPEGRWKFMRDWAVRKLKTPEVQS